MIIMSCQCGQRLRFYDDMRARIVIIMIMVNQGSYPSTCWWWCVKMNADSHSIFLNLFYNF